MFLVERLEKLAKQYDQDRWHKGKYNADAADNCDLLRAAAKEIKKNDRN